MRGKNVCKMLVTFTTVAVVGVSALPVTVMADARQEIEGAMYTQRVTYLTNQLGACAEETRIAKEYLGSLEDLARVNPSYEAYIDSAIERVVDAEMAQESAENALRLAKRSVDASESNALPVNEKHTIGVFDAAKTVKAQFDVETTGAPKDPSSKLIISDFPQEYLDYEGYHILARYYAKESLKEVLEHSETAGKKTRTITVDGEMPGGGYADQVAVEISVENGKSLVFLWEEDGRVSVVDRD